MKKAHSISLLLLIGVIIFPWQVICIAHPTGHDHHKHDGQSPCELRRQYKGTEPAYFPPMDCKEVFFTADEYQLPDNVKVKPTIKTVSVAAVLFELLPVALPEQPFVEPSDPECNSGPPQPVNHLRGLPSC